jgi:maleylpyruvate isomerase
MTAVEWMDSCTELFLGTVDGLSDSALAEPSLLPDWSRKHVVAHVHFNALALGRLVSWASTGVESRMYAGPEQRVAEIEGASSRPAHELRALVHRSAEELAGAVAALPEDAWSHLVVTARGREVPASQVPWMRAREVAVHAVDLSAGPGFDDLPPELLRELSTEAVAMHGASGDAASIAAWLTGRSERPPQLAAWL